MKYARVKRVGRINLTNKHHGNSCFGLKAGVDHTICNEGSVFYVCSYDKWNCGYETLDVRREVLHRLIDVEDECPNAVIEFYNESDKLSYSKSYCGISDPNPVSQKLDAGKPKMEILFDHMPDALLEVAKVLTIGEQKYSVDNFKTLDDAERRFKGAMLRHLAEIGKGNPFDEETGVDHYAHVASNAIILAQLSLSKRKA